jgi:hypothetical protein
LIEGVKVLRKIWGVEGVSSGNLSDRSCTRLFGKLVFLSGSKLVCKGRGRPGKRKTEEVKQKGYKEILGKGK